MMKRAYIPPRIWEVPVVVELPLAAGSGSENDHADSKENPLMFEEGEERTFYDPDWTKVKGVWSD